MKKILHLIFCLCLAVPVLATDETSKLTKKCIKHPEKCQQSCNYSKDVRVGAFQSDIVKIMGSPDIITKDSEGQETWVYDKVSSIKSYPSSNFGFGKGGLDGAYKIENKKEKQENKNTHLTIVIKFDENRTVTTFSYQLSSF